MPIYHDEFKKWKNSSNTLVETGLGYDGTGVMKAIEAGYDTIYTIEVDEVTLNNTKALLESKPEWNNKKSVVNIILGDSSVVLEDIVGKIEGKALFWLDAHWGDCKNAFEMLPLVKELRILQKYPDKVGSILIDDIRCTQDDKEKFFPWTKQELIDEILKINPKFKISYTDGFCENDIMVASLEEVKLEQKEVKKTPKKKK